MTNRRRFLGMAVAAAVVPPQLAHATSKRTLYLGTYGNGIGLARYDVASGRITSTGALEEVANPSFLIRRGRHLYAVNEQADGGVTAIAVGPKGDLRVLNRESTGGSAPCHLALVDRHLLSANYGTGDVAVHPVRADGSLGVRTDLVRHAGAQPHAHQVLADPTGRFVLAVDLGTDSIYTYRLKGGKLDLKSQASMKTGAGPRHMAFHPSGRYAYVANELDSTIAVCGYDVSGRLTPRNVQTTVPDGLPTRNYPAEVAVSKDGRFVYLTNRGHNSIAVFAVEAAGARLRLLGTPSCGGDWPRHLAFDPTGRLLLVANQRSNTVATFHVDRRTGLPARAAIFDTPIPACVLPV